MAVLTKSSAAALGGGIEVRIPKEYTSIEEGAFQNSSYKTVVIYGSLKSIGDYAFNNSNLQTGGYIFYPVKFLEDGLETIGKHAFSSTKIKEIRLPNSLITIGDYAFADTDLDEVNFGSNIQHIGEGAFQNSSVRAVKMPDTITSIGKNAFARNGVGTLKLSSNLSVIPRTAFFGHLLKDLRIPESVTTIGESAFQGSGLSGYHLSFSPSVSYLGPKAFAGNKIESVYIPSSIKVISEGAFRDNQKLRSLTISDGVERIDDYAFYNTDLNYGRLKSRYPTPTGEKLVIPDSVTSIGQFAFDNIRHLSVVELHEDTSYARSSFSEYTKLKFRTDLTPPSSIYFTELSFSEDDPIGTAIATLHSSDKNITDTHTYRLVNGKGSEDNGFFKIKENKLLVNKPVDYESKSSYSIRLETRDSGGLTFAKAFKLYVEDIKSVLRSSTDLTLPSNVEDLVLTGKKHLKGYGNNGKNRLTGNSGNNLLNGKGDVDVMIGNGGNDTYIVNHVNDRVIEKAKGGNDTIRSSVNELLSVHVENLVLTGKKHLKGYGNNGRNRLAGNSGNNVLKGKGGIDVLNGQLGNDIVNGGAGVDTAVFSKRNNHINLNSTKWQDTGDGKDRLISIENVNAGAGNDVVTGNKAANKLDGQKGNDFIYGGGGKDLLIGGGGKDKVWGQGGRDTFRIERGTGYTIIKDYSDGADRIHLGSGHSAIKLRSRDDDLFIYQRKDLLAIVEDVSAGDLQMKGNYLF